MTDETKMILEAIQGLQKDILEVKAELADMKTDVTDLKSDVVKVKRQIMKSTAELKAMDEIILDEVERVHSILDKHKEDKTVHSA